MDIKQLITFTALAEQNNYLKVAERLNYAPSTLAKHIHSLECELGTKLVIYQDNKIKLTPEGYKFQEYARRILHVYWEAEEAFADTTELGGSVRIAGGEPIVGFSLSGFFLSLCTQHTKVNFNVQMICCARVPAWLKNREVDVGFIHEMELVSSAAYEIVPLYNEPICLVTTAENPLAGKGGVTQEDLRGAKFAFTYEDCCFTMEFRRRMRQSGVQPGAELFLGSVSAVLNCVHQEGRIALLPYSTLQQATQMENLISLDWAGEPLRAWVQILYNKNRTLLPAEKELIRQAKLHTRQMVEADAGRQLFAPPGEMRGETVPQIVAL